MLPVDSKASCQVLMRVGRGEWGEEELGLGMAWSGRIEARGSIERKRVPSCARSAQRPQGEVSFPLPGSMGSQRRPRQGGAPRWISGPGLP